MIEPEPLLTYLANSMALGVVPNAFVPSETRSWNIPYEEFRSGILGSHTTREILLEYSFRHADCSFGDSNVPLVCCLRSLINDEGSVFIPLLLMRCSLEANGSLTVDTHTRAWVPANMLATNDLHNEELALCDLDAYHAHQLAMSSLPYDGTWDTALSRAFDFFNAINQLNNEQLEDLGLQFDTAHCGLILHDDFDENACVLACLNRLSTSVTSDALKQTVMSGPARSLLCAPEEGSEDTTSETLPDDPLLAPKVLCGILDHVPLLRQNDLDVLSSFAQLGTGAALAVHAPLGTQSSTLSLAAMANYYTDCALRGDKAPSMLCVAPHDTLEHLVSLLSNRPITGHTALAVRWIPRIANANPHDTASNRRVLGPLSPLVLYHTFDGVVPLHSGAFLSQSSIHVQSDDMERYGDAWYTPKAATYYLDCVSGFLNERVKNLPDARKRLQEVLRRIDQDRCELIDAYDEVRKATELLKKRDGLVERIGRLRRGHKICRKRLTYWENVLSEHPARKSFFNGSAPNQSSLIQRMAQPNEELAQGKTLVEDVCAAYRDELARLENGIDRLRGASANLAKRVRGADASGRRCSEVIGRISRACKLTGEQTSLLESTVDGRTNEVSLRVLNAALNETVRPAEFWLAVHIYESSWIELNQRRTLSKAVSSEAERDFVDIWHTICPFHLVNSANALSMLNNLYHEEKEPLDLLVLPQAHELDVAHGIALSSRTKRLLTVGSTSTLRMRPLCLPTMDELSVKANQGEEVWNELSESSLALSSGITFFDYALRTNMQTLHLEDVDQPYESLTHVRNELFADEQIHTLRSPSQSEDDTAYALLGIAPNLSYVIVPDSSWEQKGPSRQNEAEARALFRWLNNHIEEIAALQPPLRDGQPRIGVVAPFAAQARVLEDSLSLLPETYQTMIEVRAIKDLGLRTWPIVILSTTCGPEAFSTCDPHGVGLVANMALAAATDALIVFCGNAWEQSPNEEARCFMSNAFQIGRLFSKPRKRPQRTNREIGVNRSENDESSNAAKPVSITLMLKKLNARNEIQSIPSATQMNAALRRAGLIERVAKEEGTGWIPTAAGKEAGIISSKDDRGNSFCLYTSTTEAVIARLASEVS